MKKTIIALALCVAIPALACAKKPKKVTEPEPAPAPVVTEDETPEITEECLVNISLFVESAKNKAYEDAYGPWLEVYNTCPNANKAIYSRGSQILEWKYNNAATEEEKEDVRKMVLQMHDKRIKYFGDDSKYPTAYILGQKGLDYCKFYPEDPLKLDAYNWIKESVQQMGDKSQLTVLVKLVELSNDLYKANPDKYSEQYIADYSLVSPILQSIWDNPASKNATDAATSKEYIDNLFAVSGAASCDKLDELYHNYINTNGQYLEDMLKLMRLYRRVNCTESEIYFAAAEAAHKLQPTTESASGCGSMSLKKGNYNDAIDYYKQAIELIDENDPEADATRADLQYRISYVYMDKLHRYADARTFANLSMNSNPSQKGRCYIIIGMCYAAAQPYQTPDYPAAKAAILNKTVFWAAVDKFMKAKQVDPSIADDANKLIATYSKYFPSKEELFDLPGEFGSGSFIVGGWINETTSVRAKKD